MNAIVDPIPLFNLSVLLIPVAVVTWYYARWGLGIKGVIYALARMLLQLLIIGYFLVSIFDLDNVYIILLVLTVMVLVSSWIALRTIPQYQKKWLLWVFISISCGGGVVLLLVLLLVLALKNWYEPSISIPIAGMIFANAMTAISLSSERYIMEINQNSSINQAKKKALNTAMIPLVNSLFAVGLVTLPGLMTGQVISGIPPLIAARYQIMVMLMLFSSGGLSVIIFLHFIQNKVTK
ncbi:MAG: putative ABC transport system permease protein [Francisellaceae bacterium]|jgi:putative ABC transport system permease protein